MALTELPILLSPLAAPPPPHHTLPILPTPLSSVVVASSQEREQQNRKAKQQTSCIDRELPAWMAYQRKFPSTIPHGSISVYCTNTNNNHGFVLDYIYRTKNLKIITFDKITCYIYFGIFCLWINIAKENHLPDSWAAKQPPSASFVDMTTTITFHSWITAKRKEDSSSEFFLLLIKEPVALIKWRSVILKDYFIIDRCNIVLTIEQA